MFAFDIGGSLTKLCFYDNHAALKDDTMSAFSKAIHALIEDQANYGETGSRDEDLEFSAYDCFRNRPA
jgi:hypothetical protein